MPGIFVGHGSPMNVIEDNEFTRTWRDLAKEIPKPKAIVCISAHWETHGTFVTGNLNPPTIHDFYGFPQELYSLNYPASGAPDLANEIQNLISNNEIQIDRERGFDHGAWAVLKSMYPKADIPLIQISMDRSQPPKFHYEMGKQLLKLRQMGILVVGSGNIVHNLRESDFNNPGGDELAVKFDRLVKSSITERKHIPLIEYQQLGKIARFAIPTNEHYLPMLYILGMQRPEDQVSFFCERVIFNAISMRGVKFG